MPHLQPSAAALSAPPAAASTRRRFSTRLRSPDTVRVLRFLDQAEARRATSTTVLLGGALRRSIHAELADREETAERLDRMGARMRGHETWFSMFLYGHSFLVVTIASVVGCWFVL